MKKKILIITDPGMAKEDLEELLTPYFNVKFIDCDISLALQMMELFMPDEVIINMVSNPDSFYILEAVRGHFAFAEILCLGSVADTNFKERTSQYKVSVLPIAYFDEEIIRAVCRDLYLDYGYLIRSNYTERRKRVLLVDDNALFLRNGKTMLEERFNVSVAISAKQGFNILAKRKVDIILLDYDMPEVDGRQMFIELKKDERYKDIPVIFLTALSDRDSIVQVLSLKPAGYVLKPVTKEALFERIDAVDFTFNVDIDSLDLW